MLNRDDLTFEAFRRSLLITLDKVRGRNVSKKRIKQRNEDSVSILGRFELSIPRVLISLVIGIGVSVLVVFITKMSPFFFTAPIFVIYMLWLLSNTKGKSFWDW